MQIHNMLESNGNGKGYLAGNIRLIKVKEDIVEIHKRNGEIIKFKKAGVFNEVPMDKR